jgi:hypothetical protein
MLRDFFQVRARIRIGLIAGMVMLLTVAGCSKKSGPAVILEKEHIAAKEIVASPTAQESASPSSPTPEPAEVVSEEEEKPRELREDEIVVDTYVMKKEDRGTGRDPRAREHEQWIVTVQLVHGGRRFNVHTDRSPWEKLKVGDRVNVSYREGKYTGTVWSAEIK